MTLKRLACIVVGLAMLGLAILLCTAERIKITADVIQVTSVSCIAAVAVFLATVGALIMAAGILVDPRYMEV